MTDEKEIAEILGWEWVPHSIPQPAGSPQGWWRDPNSAEYAGLARPPTVEDMLDWLIEQATAVHFHRNSLNGRFYVTVSHDGGVAYLHRESLRGAVEAAVRDTDARATDPHDETAIR